MTRFAKVLTLAATLTAAFTFSAMPVFAEGLSVSADKETCATGDKITVSIDASSVGDGSVPADIQVEFDPNRLNFEDCSVEYGGGGGGLVTFKDKSASIGFTTLSGGNAEIKVTATADDAASPETATFTLLVDGEDTAALLSASASSDTGVAPGTIDAGDGRVVQAVFADEYKPVLFHKETTEYKGQTVECAKFDMGDMILLYTTDASGNDGKFMIYDAAKDEMSEVRMIQGIENRFIIVLSDCEGPIPEGYTKAVLEWDGQTLTAFMEESVAAGSAAAVDGVDPSDFFLVYAMSSEGNKGWYRYDKNEGTYQRFLNTGASSAEGGSDDSSEEGLVSGLLDEYIPADVQSILLLVFAPLALILLITVIILAVKLHDYAEDLDAFYEDYYADEEEDDGDADDEDEEEEERYARKPARPGAVTAASLVGSSMAEDEDSSDDDEDDDEEEEEDVEEEEDASYRDDKKAARYENDEDDAAEDEEEDDVKHYKPLTRKERKELEREEKWKAREEKKAAKRRAQGYEEATPMDWSTFEKGQTEDEDERRYAKSKPPKYMTESMPPVEDEEADEAPKKAPLPPRKKTTSEADATESARPAREEDVREKQRRLFEQQQRIEEQRRIEKERQEEEQLKQQQMFIESKNEELDLDEDFQFEFLNL